MTLEWAELVWLDWSGLEDGPTVLHYIFTNSLQKLPAAFQKSSLQIREMYQPII
jgi:hypothetical protein